ncbi:HNH endonuclease domain-containing protein [Butyrivibrio proteoclasticus]|uniref:HNH endonuclease domain-containing protein n=1 Tax=Butyrivibrio proteoclasticus TaxID=43305 RepID=UPI00047B065D|nr:HNH endonuclease domain-containing protein [Butyrivibrio proteoclasticus]
MDETLFSQKVGFELHIDDKYHNALDIEGFSLMMKDPSYCYKFYWLEAIVKLISEGVRETTFDEVINEMISNAWYSVREFYIHLSGIQLDGQVRDGLERAVNKLSDLSGLPSNVSKVEIKNAIKEHDKALKEVKEQLTNMVPYRALAGFFSRSDEAADWGSIKRLTAYIERISHDVVLLPYTLGPSSKLKKEIYFEPAWITMIQDNAVAILGWIQYEKVKWLQNNNPEVPGLVYKLAPMDEKMRKLNNVHKLWDGILELNEVRDVFTGDPICSKKYDVDHFIPWSFVMNDELWNLMPMDSSLNSSKNNKLPKWDPFFSKFAQNQYLLYTVIFENDVIHKLYEACIRDNLHSIWAGQELYRKGNTKEEFYGILEKNMHPVYDSAKRQGYEIWNR